MKKHCIGIIIAIALSTLQMLACQSKDKNIGSNQKILQMVEASPRGSVAIVEQVKTTVGLVTYEIDRVRIVDPGKNEPEGESVFAEDSEYPSEKPTVTWKGDKLIVSFSRDAVVIFERTKLDRIQVEFIRRKELQGSQPIGVFYIALQDPQQTWSYQDLVAKVWETCREGKSQVRRGDILEWFKLLDIDRPLKIDTTLGSGVQVREIALTCLEELSRETFYPSEKNDLSTRLNLLAYRSQKLEEIRVGKINQEDLPAIKKAIHRWLEKKTNNE